MLKTILFICLIIGQYKSTTFNVTNLVNNAMEPPRVSPNSLPSIIQPTPSENLPTLPVQPTRPSPQPITTNTAIESSTRNLTTILPTGNLTSFSSNLTISSIPLMNLNLNDSSILPVIITAFNINTPLSNTTMCPNQINCNFYGVDTNMTGLSCKACKKEFLMTVDASGKKDCKTKQPIKNCRKSIKRPDRQNNTAFCFQCMPDYALKDDYSCALVGSVRRLSSCMDYQYSNNTVMCSNCKPGYLLDETRKKCQSGCKMTGCDSCKLVKNKEICTHCKPDTIGVYDYNLDGFSSCMTCNGFKDQIKKRFSTQ